MQNGTVIRFWAHFQQELPLRQNLWTFFPHCSFHLDVVHVKHMQVYVFVCSSYSSSSIINIKQNETTKLFFCTGISDYSTFLTRFRFLWSCGLFPSYCRNILRFISRSCTSIKYIFNSFLSIACQFKALLFCDVY